MTYLQYCIYTCIYTDVCIKNEIVLVRNQGLEKLHPLLLKPPLPLCPPCLRYYQTLATTDWFSVPTVWVPAGHHSYGMEQNMTDCFAWLPSLGAMFLRLIRVTFRFKNVCLSIVQANFRDPNVRLQRHFNMDICSLVRA